MFAEFADFKSVSAFLEADPKPTWEGEELLIMSKYVPSPGAMRGRVDNEPEERHTAT